MTKKPIDRPRDPVQLAKLIGDIATRQVEDMIDDGKNANAAAIGSKGGIARNASLTPEQRSEISQLALQARWKKND